MPRSTAALIAISLFLVVDCTSPDGRTDSRAAISGRVGLMDYPGLGDFSRVRVDLGRGEGGIAPDEEGYFTLSDLEPDAYTLTVTYVGGLTSAATRSAYRRFTQRVNARAGAEVTVGTLHLELATGEVRGVVEQSDNLSADGAEVTLHTWTGEVIQAPVVGNSFSAQDVPVGTHGVSVKKPGYAQTASQMSCGSTVDVVEEGHVGDAGTLSLASTSVGLVPGQQVQRALGATWFLAREETDVTIHVLAAFARTARVFNATHTSADAGAQPYAPFQPAYNLDIPPGENEIRLQFMDVCGYESTVYTLRIIRDDSPPVLEMVALADGQEHLTTATTGLVVLASDNVPSGLMMHVELCSVSAAGSETCEPLTTADEGWMAYQSRTTVTFTGGDGRKRARVRIKDASGAEAAESGEDDVVLDTTPPTGVTMTLDDGDDITASRAVLVHVTGTDLVTMQVRSDGGGLDPNGWRPVQSVFTLELPGIDGEKIVHAWFRDAAGNPSERVEARITLDTTPPSPPDVSLSAPAAAAGWAAGPLVNLAATSPDDDRATHKVRVWGDIAGGEVVVPWTALPMELTLTSGDGEKLVVVSAVDRAGNASTPVNTRVTLDTQNPRVLGVSLEGGATYTRSTALKLAMEVEGAARMQIACDGVLDDETWGDFAPGFTCPPVAEDGEHRVAAVFQDGAGNATNPWTGVVRVDTAAPSASLACLQVQDSGPEQWVETTSNLTLIVRDALDGAAPDGTAGSGITGMRVWEDGQAEPADWQPYVPSTAWSTAELEGNRRVNLRLRDAVGNASAEPITLDFRVVLTGDLRGTVALDDGGDPTGVTVQVLDAQDSALVVAGGTWQLSGVAAGEHDLTFTKSSYQTVTLRRVRVRANRTLDVEPVTLPRARGFLLGNVQLEAAADDSGAVISLVPEVVPPQVSGPNGDFRIDGVPIGTYAVTVAKEGFSSYTAPAVEVLEGAGTRLENVLLQRVRSGVTVVDNSPGNPFNTEYSRASTVELRITAPENHGNVCVAEASTFDAYCDRVAHPENFVPFNPSDFAAFPLSQGDGLKEVVVQFLDNTPPPAEPQLMARLEGRITVDTEPPRVGYVQLNGDAPYINSYQDTGEVTLGMQATDTRSGVHQYRYQFEGGTWSEWRSVVLAVVVPYEPAGNGGSQDGLKAVKVLFRDRAGNETAADDPAAVDDITVDTQLPVGTGITLVPDATSGATRYVRSSWVTVDITPGDAVGLKLSNRNDFSSATAIDLVGMPSLDWVLPSGDGDKTVYARFYDAAGNYLDGTWDTVVLDTTPPLGVSITVANNALYTTLPSANVVLKATGAAWYAVGEQPGFQPADWKPFTGVEMTVAVPLSPDDGQKAIYAAFRDVVTNESPTVYTTILLDNLRPVLTGVRINGGQTYATSLAVDVDILAAGDPAEMKVGCGGTLDGEGWRPFAPLVRCTLPDEDGSREVVVLLQDAAGNISDEKRDDILLDTEAPSVSATLNGGTDGEPTRSTSVEVHVQVTDALTGVAGIAVSTSDLDCRTAAYAPLSADGVVGLVLSTQTAPQRAYVCAKDGAGNPTLAAVQTSNAVVVDQVAPRFSAGPSVAGLATDDRTGYTRASEVSVTFTTLDSVDAATSLTWCVANSPTFDGETCGQPALTDGVVTLASWSLDEGDGQKVVYVRVRDRAGNEVSAAAQVVLDGTPPLSPTVSIAAADAPYTLDDLVTVELGAVGAAKVYLSESSLAPSRDAVGWNVFDPAAPSRTFDLSDQEGSKQVYAFYQDAAGNVTPASIAASTFYDKTPPTAVSVVIRGTSYYDRAAGLPVDTVMADEVATVSTSVSLTLSASDGASGSGVTEMMVANTDQFTGAVWRPFESVVPLWALTGGSADYVDRLVYLKVRDAAGRESTRISDAIKLDNVAPTGAGVVLQGGLSWVASTQADAVLSATGATFRQVSLVPSFSGAWSAFASPQTITALDLGGEGTRTVYARFRDDVGNLSQVASDSIVADATAPTQASVIVNGGAAFSTSVSGEVTLTLNAQDDGSGVSMMQFSNDGTTWSNWTDYQVTYGPWTLATPTSQNDVVKTVYARFRDRAGKVTSNVSDTIRLDNVAPTINSPGLKINNDASYARSPVVALSLPASGAFEMKIGDGAGCVAGTWQTWSATSSWALEGGDQVGRTVSAIVRDQAGNLSGCSPDSITIDTSAPIAQSLRLDGCAKATGGNCVAQGGGGDGSHDPYFTRDEYVAVTVEVNGTCSSIELSSAPSFSPALPNILTTYNCTPSPFPAVATRTFPPETIGTLYARALDAAGNVSNVVSAQVFYDPVPPEFGEVLIDAGAEYTQNQTVQVALSAADSASGLHWFYLDDDDRPLVADTGTVDGAYVPSLGYTFEGSGQVTLWASFEDRAGNRTSDASPSTIKDEIYIDTKAPNIPAFTRICRGGAGPVGCPGILRTSDTSVLLVMDSTTVSDQDEQLGDGGSRIREMKLAEGPDATALNLANWEPYIGFKSFVLGSGNGTKKLWIAVKDASGRTATATSATTLVLDTQPPFNTSVGFFETYVQTGTATGRVSAQDNLDAPSQLEVLVTGDVTAIAGQAGRVGTWTSVQNVDDQTWTLTTGQGAKTVFVRFRDQSGNETPLATVGQVFVDTAAPAAPSLTMVQSANRAAIAYWTADYSDEETSGSGIAAQVVRWGTTPGNYTTGALTVVPEARSATITDDSLQNETWYYFVVDSLDRAGRWQRSGERSALIGLKFGDVARGDTPTSKVWPEDILLSNGTLYVLYWSLDAQRPTKRAGLMLAISEDWGATWTQSEVSRDTELSVEDIPSLAALEVVANVLVVAFIGYDSAMSPSVRVVRSINSGATWTSDWTDNTQSWTELDLDNHSGQLRLGLRTTTDGYWAASSDLGASWSAPTLGAAGQLCHSGQYLVANWIQGGIINYRCARNLGAFWMPGGTFPGESYQFSDQKCVAPRSSGEISAYVAYLTSNDLMVRSTTDCFTSSVLSDTGGSAFAPVRPALYAEGEHLAILYRRAADGNLALARSDGSGLAGTWSHLDLGLSTRVSYADLTGKGRDTLFGVFADEALSRIQFVASAVPEPEAQGTISEGVASLDWGLPFGTELSLLSWDPVDATAPWPNGVLTGMQSHQVGFPADGAFYEVRAVDIRGRPGAAAPVWQLSPFAAIEEFEASDDVADQGSIAATDTYVYVLPRTDSLVLWRYRISDGVKDVFTLDSNPIWQARAVAAYGTRVYVTAGARSGATSYQVKAFGSLNEGASFSGPSNVSPVTGGIVNTMDLDATGTRLGLAWTHDGTGNDDRAFVVMSPDTADATPAVVWGNNAPGFDNGAATTACSSNCAAISVGTVGTSSLVAAFSSGAWMGTGVFVYSFPGGSEVGVDDTYRSRVPFSATGTYSVIAAWPSVFVAQGAMTAATDWREVRLGSDIGPMQDAVVSTTDGVYVLSTTTSSRNEMYLAYCARDCAGPYGWQVSTIQRGSRATTQFIGTAMAVTPTTGKLFVTYHDASEGNHMLLPGAIWRVFP